MENSQKRLPLKTYKWHTNDTKKVSRPDVIKERPNAVC